MSALFDEIIAARKAKAIEYEEYLKRIAELAKRVERGLADDTPEQLNTPGLRAIYDNLRQGVASTGKNSAATQSSPHWEASKNDVLELAIKIDETVKQVRPDGWRGVQAREQVIKAALYGVLQDIDEVERIFHIIDKQKEY